ncbi:protein TOS1 [Dipodascopsis tothii]|uniref:protein TOS1 n=1 Tax=Dipodascopsis tothii TaxID=44089 RepID=UPI0034CE8CA7
MMFSKKCAAALLALAASALADSCTTIDGNTYCNQVSLIDYQNVGFSGSYKSVSGMDDCSCSWSTSSFSGGVAPLNEQLSVHFRGPIELKQFAVYSSSGSLKKRDEPEENPEQEHAHLPRRRHAHHEHKKHKRAVEYVTEVYTVMETVYDDAGALVTAGAATTTTSAETVLTTNAPTTAMSIGPRGASSAAWYSASSEDDYSAATTFATSTSDSWESSSASSTASSSAASSSSSSIAGSLSAGVSRVGYYEASSGSSSGLTFLNNMGGVNGSGTWSSCWGNSLSFAGEDGQSAASDSQVLGDVTIPSDNEIIIFSDTECSSSSCGFYRDGIPAYEGFSGDFKVFLFEFGMPTDNSGSDNVDMPAIWFLNAKIPRTQQYGDCSCWNYGCGELDVFEVLNSGNNRLTNHLHTYQGSGSSSGGGGSTDYFERPTSGTMKAAVIFDGSSSNIYIAELDTSVSFDGSLSADVLNGFISDVTGSSVYIASS